MEQSEKIVNSLMKQFVAKQIEKVKDKVDSLPYFKVGDILKVKVAVQDEKGKKWVQTSEGYCISKTNKGLNSTFTIRRVEKDVSVLMTFSPCFQSISLEVVPKKARRSKLYYLDRCSNKKGRLRDLTKQELEKRNRYIEKCNPRLIGV